mgnify:CR=1 FL=1
MQPGTDTADPFRVRLGHTLQQHIHPGILVQILFAQKFEGVYLVFAQQYVILLCLYVILLSRAFMPYCCAFLPPQKRCKSSAKLENGTYLSDNSQHTYTLFLRLEKC